MAIDHEPKNPNRLKGFAKVTAVGALAIAALSGCGETTHATPPDAGQVTTTAEATPGQVETESPESRISTFLGTTIPESLNETPEALPIDIMRGDFYETLNTEQKARVDAWYDAIYNTGTFLQLPIEERMAAMSYVFAANSAHANNRIDNSDRYDIKQFLEKAGTPSSDNTVEQAAFQVEAYAIFAHQLAFDSDPSPDATVGVFDKILAGNLLAGMHTDAEGQQILIDNTNRAEGMTVLPTEAIMDLTVFSGTRTGDTIQAELHDGEQNVGYVKLSLITFTDINNDTLQAWIAN